MLGKVGRSPLPPLIGGSSLFFQRFPASTLANRPARLRTGLFRHPGLRLLHVRSLFRSIAMETWRAVLTELRVRPLERRRNFRPNRNRRGSPNQRREAIQRRKSQRTRVSAVRTHPANPFENRTNFASGGRPERVRKGDSGGGDGTGVQRSLAYKPLISF